MVDSGLTLNVSVSATVGVTNGSNGSLKIQGSGATGDNPLLIKFYDTSTTIPVRFGTTQDTQLTTIKTNTDKIININDKLTSNTFNVRVVESPRPRNVLSGSQVPTTSPQPLASNTKSSIILRSGINMKSPITNTSTIYVGSSVIVANKAAAYPLEPGESLFIECDDIASLYCYGIIDAEKQKIIYIGS